MGADRPPNDPTPRVGSECCNPGRQGWCEPGTDDPAGAGHAEMGSERAGTCQAVDRDASTVRSASSALTSDSRNLRCPPGVLIDPMRPADAHRVTVFGSTRNISATSPGVSNLSEISMVTCHLHIRAPTGLVRRAGVCPLCDIANTSSSVVPEHLNPTRGTDRRDYVPFVLILH